MLSMSLVEAGESPKEESALQEETKLYTLSEASHDMKSNKEGASCDACEVPTLTASLAEEEERILLSLNSTDFGFVAIRDHAGASETETVGKMVLERGVRCWSDRAASDQEYYCKVGHLCLLLEKFEEAQLNYEKYQTSCPGQSSEDVHFLYGLGMVYFHFSTELGSEAIEKFKQILGFFQNFNRRNECALRIAIICNKQRNYSDALKYFQEVVADNSPCTLSRPEVVFYLGHVYGMLGRSKEAVEKFEEVLSYPHIGPKLRSLAYRQQGWMYHTSALLDSVCSSRSDKAIGLLKSAVGANPSSWQAWYLLGKCYEKESKLQDSFVAFQQAINRNSGRAEVWSAIGCLYHQLGQAYDALQSYISAVYIDTTYVQSWQYLGILYESVHQVFDAVLCYKNGLKYCKPKDVAYSVFISKMDFLRSASRQTSQKLLPSLLEAWPHLVAPQAKKIPRQPCTPLLSDGALIEASADSFGSVHGRNRDRSKGQDPIIIHSGLSHSTLLQSPTYPPNQTVSSAYGQHTPLLMPQYTPSATPNYGASWSMVPPQSTQHSLNHHEYHIGCPGNSSPNLPSAQLASHPTLGEDMCDSGVHPVETTDTSCSGRAESRDSGILSLNEPFQPLALEEVENILVKLECHNSTHRDERHDMWPSNQLSIDTNLTNHDGFSSPSYSVQPSPDDVYSPQYTGHSGNNVALSKRLPSPSSGSANKRFKEATPPTIGYDFVSNFSDTGYLSSSGPVHQLCL